MCPYVSVDVIGVLACVHACVLRCGRALSGVENCRARSRAQYREADRWSEAFRLTFAAAQDRWGEGGGNTDKGGRDMDLEVAIQILDELIKCRRIHREFVAIGIIVVSQIEQRPHQVCSCKRMEASRGEERT